jgi:hypothetical protein
MRTGPAVRYACLIPTLLPNTETRTRDLPGAGKNLAVPPPSDYVLFSVLPALPVLHVAARRARALDFLQPDSRT